jgi:hypothetical protein
MTEEHLDLQSMQGGARALGDATHGGGEQNQPRRLLEEDFEQGLYRPIE